MRALILRVLHVPLLWKLLLANMTMMMLFAFAGAVMAVQHVATSPSDPHYDLLALFVVIGVSLNLVVSFGLIQLLLAPWKRFEKAVDESRQGKGTISQTSSLIGDEQLDGLIAAFTNMQDTLERNSQQAQRAVHGRRI